MSTTDKFWAFFALVVVLCITTVFLNVQRVTHESHLNQIKYSNTEMLKCIDSERTAAECRVLVYGSY